MRFNPHPDQILSNLLVCSVIKLILSEKSFIFSVKPKLFSELQRNTQETIVPPKIRNRKCLFRLQANMKPERCGETFNVSEQTVVQSCST